MKFSCEKCGRSYVADEKVRGRAFKMKCKTCGSVIVVKPGAPAAHDPFALSPADPFSLPAGDPFAKPPADPFVTATREEAPQGGAARPAEAPQELELEIPSDDPFARAAQAEAAPAPHSVPAPADAVTTPGLPQLSEADAMFADLAEEMRTAHPPAAELPPAPAPAPAESAAPPAREPAARPATRAEAPPLSRAPSPTPAPPAPAPAAKSSRAGLVLAAAAALIVAVAGAAWVALKPGASGAPEHAAAAAPPPAAAPERRSVPEPRAAPAPAAATAAAPRQERVELPSAADTLPPAALADLHADEATQKKRPDDRRPAEPQKAAKPAAAKPAAAKPIAAAKPREPEPAPPPPPPEQSKPEVKVAQVQVQQRSRRVVEQAPPPDVHTAPSAPPLTSNADLPPLDDAMIEATVAKYARSFDTCVVAARENEPQLALGGRKVVVTMTVNPNGKALYPTLDDVELSGSEFGKCVKRESVRMTFPEFGGEPIRARVPLTLK